MCGLIGLASNEGWQGATDRKEFMRDGLCMSSLRGSHSTGIALVPKEPGKEDAVIYKRAMHPFDFVDTKKFDKSLMWIEKHRHVLGHTRFATVGKINQETAHPFHFDGIFMVHNGTLVDWRKLVPDEQFISDSEMLCYLLSTVGPYETFKQIEGAWAVVWSDTETGKLHLARNAERSLSFATIKDQDTIVFASEGGMLKWCAQRVGLPIDTTYSIDPNHMLTLPAEGKLDQWHYEKLEVRTQVKKIQQVGFQGNQATNQQAAIALLKAVRSDYPSGKTVKFTISETVQKNKPGKRAVGFVRGWTHDDAWTKIESVEGVQLAKVDKDFVYIGKVNGYTLIDKLPTLIVNKIRKTQEEDPWLEAKRQRDAEEQKAQEDMLVGPGNQFITEKEFYELTKYGCSFCNVQLSVDEADDVLWTSQDQPLCTRCVEDWTKPGGKFCPTEEELAKAKAESVQNVIKLFSK